MATIEQRNHFIPGDEIEVFSPNFRPIHFKVEEILDTDGNLLDAARHPKQMLEIYVPFKVSKYDMLRKVK